MSVPTNTIVPGSSNVAVEANSLDRCWEEICKLPKPPGVEEDPRLSASYEIVLNGSELNLIEEALKGKDPRGVGALSDNLFERVKRAASWRVMVPLIMREGDKFNRDAGGPGASLDCVERHPTLDWVLDAQGRLNRAMTDEDLKAGVRMPLLTVIFGDRRALEGGVREFMVTHYELHTSGLPHRYPMIGGSSLAAKMRSRPVSYGFDEDDEEHFPFFEES